MASGEDCTVPLVIPLLRYRSQSPSRSKSPKQSRYVGATTCTADRVDEDPLQYCSVPRRKRNPNTSPYYKLDAHEGKIPEESRRSLPAQDHESTAILKHGVDTLSADLRRMHKFFGLRPRTPSCSRGR